MIAGVLLQQVLDEIKRVSGADVTHARFSSVGGGSINDAYRFLTTDGQSFFCKINSATKFPSLFNKEKAGLEYLAAQQVIRIPRVFSLRETPGHQLLLLEWIEQGLKTTTSWKTLGKQLAALHHKTADQFGLDYDNYMGALPQPNRFAGNWCDFFIQERLQPHVKTAVDRQLLNSSHVRLFERLYLRLPDIFAPEPPCLLHGDLWSGNYMCDEQENPVLIDPAVYYGHRSMDLAMTTLFGGFDKPFYESYHYHYPFPEGFRDQWEVCNLYPLLIHLILFGQSYQGDILRTIQGY